MEQRVESYILWCDSCRTRLKNIRGGGYTFISYTEMIRTADNSGWTRVRLPQGYIASYCLRCSRRMEQERRASAQNGKQ